MKAFINISIISITTIVVITLSILGVLFVIDELNKEEPSEWKKYAQTKEPYKWVCPVCGYAHNADDIINALLYQKDCNMEED